MRRAVTHVSLGNFLSFAKFEVELGDLTVLVGPNGAGKTNLLNAFRFIGEIARTDLGPAVEALGGMPSIIFQGRAEPTKILDREVRVEVSGLMTEHASEKAPDRYALTLKQSGRTITRTEELTLKRTKGRGRRINLSGSKIEFIGATAARPDATLEVQQTSSGLAIIRRLGEKYDAPQVEEIAQVFETLRLVDIDVAAARRPSVVREGDRLRSDAANLAAFLDWMRAKHPDAYESVCEDVRYVLPSFEYLEYHKLGGAEEAVRIDIKERNLASAIPLSRASFGTIRAIALFAMLHDPNPPKLTCMEEVDHGLHPHALDRLVDRLREASKRTQIIVATHSPALVNRLTPEELVVLERDPTTGATVRPDITTDQMREMAKQGELGLGELWFSGTLGGGLQ